MKPASGASARRGSTPCFGGRPMVQQQPLAVADAATRRRASALDVRAFDCATPDPDLPATACARSLSISRYGARLNAGGNIQWSASKNANSAIRYTIE